LSSADNKPARFNALITLGKIGGAAASLSRPDAARIMGNPKRRTLVNEVKMPLMPLAGSMPAGAVAAQSSNVFTFRWAIPMHETAMRHGRLRVQRSAVVRALHRCRPRFGAF
jgi:hypothetical protein